MNGFGFIEYEDPMDARDVVPGQYPKISKSDQIRSDHIAEANHVSPAYRTLPPCSPLTHQEL